MRVPTLAWGINKAAALLRLWRLLEWRSQRYWRRADDPRRAMADYYADRERAVLVQLATLPEVDRALDVGCGDGSFTLLLRSHARHITGFDIGPELIAAAQSAASAAGVTNVDFRTGELAEDLGAGYGLVTCLGVTTCILDDRKFRRVAGSLASAIRPGGHLLTIDTLAPGRRRVHCYRDGRVAAYRAQGDYTAAFAAAGLEVQSSELVRAWPAGDVNRLFSFRMPTVAR